jgi:transposase
MLSHVDLPNDIDALKALLLVSEQEVRERGEVVARQREQLTTSSVEIEHLKLMIAKLRRMQFGRKSEKLDHQIEQLELQLGDLQAAEAKREMTATDRAPGAKSARKPLPEHLPRDEQIQALPTDSCPDCGGGLRHLGKDVAEQLEFVPASFRVIRHVRPKLACTCCDTIVQAPAPSRPIARGIAGPGLLAHILVAKFADHLPLYRQSVIYAREGVELERALLANWVGAASALLRPLVDSIRRHVLAGRKLHADDTPIPVLVPGNGKTKTARLWTYVRDDRSADDATPAAVWFAYTPDRKGIHPQTHLAKFKGVLQADAYAGFNALYVDGTIQEAACWAYARRKFYDLHAARPSPMTTEALRRIDELCVIEVEIRGKPPDERLLARQERARPLLDDLERWLHASLEKLSRMSDTAAAKYALNLWPALLRRWTDRDRQLGR